MDFVEVAGVLLTRVRKWCALKTWGLRLAKRVFNIDPPTSPNAMMRRATPYRGENSGPGRYVTGSLNPIPELENSIGFPGALVIGWVFKMKTRLGGSA